jgi:hypothetical protein
MYLVSLDLGCVYEEQRFLMEYIDIYEKYLYRSHGNTHKAYELDTISPHRQ